MRLLFRIFAAAVLTCLLALPAVSQQSARESRELGKQRQKEARNQAKRAQRAARQSQKSTAQELKRLHRDRQRETKQLQKGRKKQGKEIESRSGQLNKANQPKPDAPSRDQPDPLERLRDYSGAPAEQ